MSTAVWPPIDATQLASEQAASQVGPARPRWCCDRRLMPQARELEWLLLQLRETLQALKAGLEECAALLAPTENGSTLVLSSVRSESLKGLVTRVGTRIVKGVRDPAASCYAPWWLMGPSECQTTTIQPSTSPRLRNLRLGHLLRTPGADACHPTADLGPHLDKHLPGRH